MNHPIIHEAIFDPAMDCAINSALLKQIFSSFEVKYDRENDQFTSKFAPWGVSVEDQHDEEKKPHYILRVGEGDFKKEELNIFKARYCDYKSSTDTEENGIISTNPGVWKIFIWLPKRYSALSNHIASQINNAYAEVMEKVLPEYFIPSFF